MCGRLNKSMYGTRDAAVNWEKSYTEFMISRGFTQGVASPCCFYSKERDIRAVIHGDDFTMMGGGESLDWFRREIVKRFEVKFKGRLGPEKEDDKSIRVLNRVVSWDEEGIKYEADQRHAEIIAQSVIEEGTNTRGISTPCEDEKIEEESEESITEIGGKEATMFRAMVARGNYLAQDRTDILLLTSFTAN
jgi:hypothetical protein